MRNDVRFADYTLCYKQIGIINGEQSEYVFIIRVPEPVKMNVNVRSRTFSSLMQNVILNACNPGYLHTKIFINYYYLSECNYFATNRYLNRLSRQTIQLNY